MKHKVGEIIKIKEEFEIKTSIGENTIPVKKGDTGFMDSKGMIHYLTGEARNKIQKIDDIEVKGYDYESIAKLIFKRLNIEYNICEMLENEGIEGHEFRDTIEDVLTDIF